MAEVQLSRGVVALVDDDDLAAVAAYRWHATEKGYARTNIRVDGRRTTLYMHRLLHPGVPAGMDIDHANGNGLDNRRQNIRVATRSENRRNQHRAASASGSKGVYWHKRDRRWQAILGKKHLGYFTDKADAINAYNVAAQAQYGEFACLTK